ncbi:MAG: ABC transporter substrate-binding protein, partial [Bacillota bacterium]
NQVGWRIAQTNSILSEAEARGYELVYTDAQENTQQQIEDVKYIVSQNVDYLILDPREYEASAEALEITSEAGIPVIVVDREVIGVVGTDFVTSIGPDIYWEGQAAAEWLCNARDGQARIVEITGTPGSSAMIDRQKGFMDVINSQPGIVVVESKSGNFIREEAQKAMAGLIESIPGQFDTIFVHNDDMAVGVMQALKAAGIMPGKDVMVIGIDGQKEAVQAIIDGEMACTVTCSPYYGPLVFDTIERLIQGENVSESIVMPDYVIDSTNALEELNKAF